MIIIRERKIIMNNISNYLVPLAVILIIMYAFWNKVDVYESFLKGAKEGISIVLQIAPTIIGMVFAIEILIKSSFLEFIFSFVYPLLDFLSLPSMILPMAFIRPISGTATLAIMSEIFKVYGPDSFAGFLASVMQGCTDTTIYVLALYFGSIGVVKTKHALKAGLLSDIVGIFIAFVISYIFFK